MRKKIRQVIKQSVIFMFHGLKENKRKIISYNFDSCSSNTSTVCKKNFKSAKMGCSMNDFKNTRSKIAFVFNFEN